MREKVLALTLALALLFSAVAGAMLVNLGRANPHLPYLPGGEIRPEKVGAEPPVITILSPQNNSVTNQGNMTLSVNVSSGNSSGDSSTWIDRVRYEADWLQNDVYVYINGYNELPPALNLTGINGARIPEGKHNVTVYATEQGQYRDNTPRGAYPGTLYTFSIEGSAIIFFTVDRTSPIVSVLLLENKTYETSDVPLNFTVNESVSKVKYSLDGLNNVTVAGNTTLAGLPNGNHNVTVYATDEAGNTGASETMYFSVEPFPTTVVIASVVTVAVIGVGLLVYFKKRKH